MYKTAFAHTACENLEFSRAHRACTRTEGNVRLYRCTETVPRSPSLRTASRQRTGSNLIASEISAPFTQGGLWNFLLSTLSGTRSMHNISHIQEKSNILDYGKAAFICSKLCYRSEEKKCCSGYRPPGRDTNIREKAKPATDSNNTERYYFSVK